MNWVDFILNMAGLLLWLNWRAGKFDPVGKRTPATLIGTLRSTASQKVRGWDLPIALGALLFLRAVFYRLIGPALQWTGTVSLGVISLSFRSDWFGRILLFSIFSFVLTLGVFYSWLILLSLLQGPKPTHNFVRMQLGGVDGWPQGIKILLPFLVTAIIWWAISWLLTWMQLIPRPGSEVWRMEVSMVMGLESYLIWKFPIAALLALRFLNNHIYFGRHPVWGYADNTAEKILQPLKVIPLRAGKVDLAPIAGIAMIFLITELAQKGLMILYRHLV